MCKIKLVWRHRRDIAASEGSDVALQLLWEEPGGGSQEQWDTSFALVECGLPRPISGIKYFSSISCLETNI